MIVSLYNFLCRWNLPKPENDNEINSTLSFAFNFAFSVSTFAHWLITGADLVPQFLLEYIRCTTAGDSPVADQSGVCTQTTTQQLSLLCRSHLTLLRRLSMDVARSFWWLITATRPGEQVPHIHIQALLSVKTRPPNYYFLTFFQCKMCLWLAQVLRVAVVARWRCRSAGKSQDWILWSDLSCKGRAIVRRRLLWTREERRLSSRTICAVSDRRCWCDVWSLMRHLVGILWRRVLAHLLPLMGLWSIGCGVGFHCCAVREEKGIHRRAILPDIWLANDFCTRLGR